MTRYYKPLIGQNEDGSAMLGELRTRDNRNSRKRRRDRLAIKRKTMWNDQV